MNKIKKKVMSSLWLVMTFLGTGSVHAQSAIDYSSLSDASPQEQISQTENYKEALAEGKWTSLNTVKSTSEWKALYANDCFVQSFSTLGVKPYESSLVSPALQLSVVGGQTLTFDWAAGTVKGDIHLKALLIDKNGTIINELTDIVGEVGSSNSNWHNASVTLPKINGTGFIAFYTSGDKDNRASFRVRNIQTVAGTLTTAITTTPNMLDFQTVNVGETSDSKKIQVLVSNFTGVPSAKITAGDASDFLLGENSLSANGGEISVFFAPTSIGEKNATLTVSAGDQKAEVTLTGKGEGKKSTGPTVELLKDEFFYTFQGNNPKEWSVKGMPTKLESSDRYNGDTGFGLGIKTDKEGGYIKQIIDLNTQDKIVIAGDELECLLHYYTVNSEKEEGPFRLALRWLDANGQELESGERGLINNPNLYFGRHKSYADLRFRTICPAGATQLEFAIEIAPNSDVRFDDFSVLRLSEQDKTPLVTVLPQFRTIYGEVGKTETYPVAIQGMHLAQDQQPKFSGISSSKVLSLDVTSLPKNGTLAANLSVTPTEKGAFTTGNNAYTFTFGGADPDNTGRLTLTSYFKAAGATPTIAIAENNEIKEMKAEPGKTDQQTLEFTATDVINSVTVEIIQPAGGPFTTNTSIFYYSTKSDKILNNNVRIDFKPIQPGTYNATLVLSTQLADTLRIPIVGVAKKATGDDITEKFSADNKMDSRFTGKTWTGYHKFDQGYYRLDGKWNAPGNVTVNKNGHLYYDELSANGLNGVTIEPANQAASFNLEYSIDGGGHWTAVTNADNQGFFAIGTHRPTLYRLTNISDNDVEITSVKLIPNLEADRENFANIADAMIPNADKEPLALLNETFSGLRHTRILGLDGWQNLTLRGERPFYAWQQKNDAQTVIENECAQISFLHYGYTDDRPHESWLVSPTLSYKKAQSKNLTFSVRFQNVTENGGELFGFYIINEKDGKITEKYIDLNDYVPMGVTVEAEKWFDYNIDLSTIDSLDIDDKFHVAFSFYSPRGGNATILNFMIDDVTFGRTDLPEISVDKSLVNIPFQPGLQAQPQTFTVNVQRATAPITLTLVPSSMGTYFKVAAPQLTREGGIVAIGYKSDEATPRAAILLIQTRGAVPVPVKLLATQISTGIKDLTPDNSVSEPVNYYSVDGKQLSKPEKGITIVRKADGKVYKEVRR